MHNIGIEGNMNIINKQCEKNDVYKYMFIVSLRISMQCLLLLRGNIFVNSYLQPWYDISVYQFDGDHVNG